MRLFVAIKLEKEIKDVLSKIQVSMRRQGIEGNFTTLANMHLTLAFIGEYPGPEKVKKALARIQFDQFQIALEGSGNFHDVWWIGLQKSNALDSLAASVRQELKKDHIPFDEKPFSSHITILRKPEKGKPQECFNFQNVPNLSMMVSKICLMESQRGPHGMIYTELASISAQTK